MSVRYHGIPGNLFAALAAGGGGPDAIRALAAARRSKLGILLLGVLEAAQEAGAEQARLARQGSDLLDEVERHDREAAETAIRHPSVGAWALRTVRASRSGLTDPGAEPGRLSTVAAAAAIRAGLTAEIEVKPADGTVMLPLLGAAIVDGRHRRGAEQGRPGGSLVRRPARQAAGRSAQGCAGLARGCDRSGWARLTSSSMTWIPSHAVFARSRIQVEFGGRR